MAFKDTSGDLSFIFCFSNILFSFVENLVFDLNNEQKSIEWNITFFEDLKPNFNLSDSDESLCYAFFFFFFFDTGGQSKH